LQGSDASPAITVGATGTTTFAENATLSGSANNIGTVTAGTLGTAVTGDAFKNGTCFFVANASGSNWESAAVNDKVEFTTIEIDDDSCCSVSGSTVRFTAPAAGYYMFGFSLYVAMDDQSNAFNFYVSGSSPLGNGAAGHAQNNDYGVGSIDALSAADHQISMTRILKLTSSQYVEVGAVIASEYFPQNCSFHGCRIG
jgi:hypothetical protein